MIRITNLRFRYPDGEFRLDIPDLAVEAGESVAFIGPSGSGKTTLLHLIAGVVLPQAGTIRTDTATVTDLGDGARRDFRIRNIGLVFQEFELLEYLNVLDNVLLPYRLTPLLELDESVCNRARDLVADLGIGDKLDRFPGQLSQGERQRVALARALVTRPGVVLGDEPTGNLDPANRDHVIDALLSYGRDTNAPVVVVTHDHDLLPRFDRVIQVSELIPSNGGRNE